MLEKIVNETTSVLTIVQNLTEKPHGKFRIYCARFFYSGNSGKDAFLTNLQRIYLKPMHAKRFSDKVECGEVELELEGFGAT